MQQQVRSEYHGKLCLMNKHEGTLCQRTDVGQASLAARTYVT